MRSLCRAIEKVAPTNATVLVLGDSGTGKELMARALHRLSGRSHQPFVAINCAAIPDTLLESELFGYEKGAFTGAAKRTAGKLELADTGTVFLDEIGEMPASLQAKLLRVLQERTVDRIGGRTPDSARPALHLRHQPQSRSADRQRRRSARICTTASAKSRCAFRRCGTGRATACCSRNSCCRTRPSASAGRRAASRRTPSARSRRIAGRATCASSRTASRAR